MSCPVMNNGGSEGEKSDEGAMTYHSYLQLDKLLTSQVLQSGMPGCHGPVHDEHLFIIVHQVYELWFKQILVELKSVRKIFLDAPINESHMLIATSRLNRVTVILKLIAGQFQVIETMTPMDFLDFRGYLSTASGFESIQFRLLENLIGVKKENRVSYQQHYSSVFQGKLAEMLAESERSPSLLDVVMKWLERTPGLEEEGFNFPKRYAAAVHDMLQEELKEAESADCSEEQRAHLKKACEQNHEMFDSLFKATKHQALVDRGDRRLSHKAMLGALLIFLYRDEPRFNQPFQLLQQLMDVDSLLMRWRHNHVLMVQRMIGTRAGTGGSSGYHYLRSTVSDRYKVFVDFFNLSSFIISRTRLPALTPEFLHELTTHAGAADTVTDTQHPSVASDESILVFGHIQQDCEASMKCPNRS